MGFGLGYNKLDFEKNQQKAFKKCKEHNLVLNIQNHGIASRIGNNLYINKNMFHCTGFFNDVIDHELRHSGNYTKTDLAMDMFEGSLVTSLAFCLRFPKGFSHFIPVGKNAKGWFVDINQMIVYSMMIFLGLVFWYLIHL